MNNQELRYKYMNIVKRIYKLKKDIREYNLKELDRLISRYIKKKLAVLKISFYYKIYINNKQKNKTKSIETQTENNGIVKATIETTIETQTESQYNNKELLKEIFNQKQIIKTLEYKIKCQKIELNKKQKYIINSSDEELIDNKIKNEISYNKVPELSLHKMRRYLSDKKIEIKKEYSKHNYKQLINRMNNDRYNRIFNIQQVN